MRVTALLLIVILAVAGCAAPQQPYASKEEIAAVSYRNDGPYSLTLLTMVNNRSGAGAHTSLLIAADERILFDPAGSFRARGIPERNDVLFGISPQAEKIYISAHARETHHVVSQKIEVSAEQARLAYRLALGAGPVAGSYCANSTAAILQEIPGFESIRTTFYPVKLADQFGALPGVTTTVTRENDDPSLEAALALLD